MLNEAERFQVVKFFRICTIVGQLPTQVDLTNWQLNSPSTRKKCIAALFFIVFVLLVLYKIGSLGYALLFVSDVPLHQLVIHIVVVLAYSTIAFWYILIYVQNPSLFAVYFSTTLLGIFGDSLGPEEKLNKKWKLRLQEYSVQDMIAVSMPYMVIAAVPIVMGAFIYDPSMRLLLYSALPENIQNWATFALCLLQELWLLLMCVIIITPTWQLQVISFERTTNQLLRLIRKIQNGTQTGRSVYRILRSLQLYVGILNNLNRYVIFTWKLLSISLCVLSGYAAVAHFGEHPIFGVMYYAILFDVAIIYGCIYEKAFKIPQLFEQAARSSLLHLRGNRNDIFRRQIRSIAPTGIKVGDFHTMERASTLIFVNFVLVNIVNMLVAYG